MDEDQPQIGGADWEQGASLTAFILAFQTGDADQVASALSMYGASLGTRTTAAMSALAIPVLVEIRGMREDRTADARIFDHKLDLILTSAELSQTMIGGFEARLALMESRFSEHERTHAADHDDLEARLARVEVLLDKLLG